MKVELLEIFGNDDMVANAARVSYNKIAAMYTVEENEKLILFLAKKNHWSPFTHPKVQFRLEMPIYVERQIIKTTVGVDYNSVSGRYVNFSDGYTIINCWRKQSTSSKQGSGEDLDEKSNVAALFFQDAVISYCTTAYQELLQLGIAKEQARTILPLNLETTFIWTGSLLAYINFWKLRITRDTQAETMQIAQDMLHELKDLLESIHFATNLLVLS